MSNVHQSDSTTWKITNRLLNQETNRIPSLYGRPFSLNQLANNSNDLRIEQVIKTSNYLIKNSINYVTFNEIKIIIINVPSKKSPGHDRITNLMLKKLPNKEILYLTSIFNALLCLGYFPHNWKKAIVILIKINPHSYKPISLLTCLSKMFEKLNH